MSRRARTPEPCANSNPWWHAWLITIKACSGDGYLWVKSHPTQFEYVIAPGSAQSGRSGDGDKF